MKATVKIYKDGEILKALKPEEARAISDAKVYLSDGKLTIEIEAEDLSDLRAALNSWLRLVKMCLDIEVLV